MRFQLHKFCQKILNRSSQLKTLGNKNQSLPHWSTNVVGQPSNPILLIQRRRLRAAFYGPSDNDAAAFQGDHHKTFQSHNLIKCCCSTCGWFASTFLFSTATNLSPYLQLWPPVNRVTLASGRSAGGRKQVIGLFPFHSLSYFVVATSTNITQTLNCIIHVIFILRLFLFFRRCCQCFVVPDLISSLLSPLTSNRIIVVDNLPTLTDRFGCDMECSPVSCCVCIFWTGSSSHRECSSLPI